MPTWIPPQERESRQRSFTALLAACGGGDAAPTAPTGQAPPAAVVTTIRVSPANATLTAIDDTRQLTATARDQAGGTMSGVVFTWSSSDDEVATVDEGGLVTARGHGTATITAAASDVQGTASAQVEQTADAVTVEPAEATFSAPGEQIQFQGMAEDANGHPVAAERFVWSSSATDVVTVDAQGLVTAGHPRRAELRGHPRREPGAGGRGGGAGHLGLPGGALHRGAHLRLPSGPHR